MADSALVTGLPCNTCPSSDAMAEYIGHFFCFSCRTRTNKQGERQVYKTSKEVPEDLECEEEITFKVNKFGRNAKAWLYSVGITDSLIKLYHIGYIPELDRVYIPNYRGNTLIGYQTRALSFYDKPKYLGKGQKMCYLSRGKCTSKVVLVEDVLSCIRVGEHCSAISLQGTSLNDEGLAQVLSTFNSVRIWLDSDLAGITGDKKLTRQLCLFVPCSSIVTKEDPKTYTYKEIGDILSTQ